MILILAPSILGTQIILLPENVSAATQTVCQKASREVANADKAYVALQYGIIQAAQNYINSTVISNLLLYNDSIMKVLQAANVEYKFATTNPKCYSTINIAKYNGYIANNLKTITKITNANINGQIVGTPKTWLTYKPVGLVN